MDKKNEPSWLDRLLLTLSSHGKTTLLLFAFISCILSVIFMPINPATGFGYLAIMFICLVFFDIKKITKLKATLTSIEMEKTISEGQETIKGLKELAVSLSNSTSSILATYGYLNVLNRESCEDLRNDIEKSLVQLGLEGSIDEAFMNWNKVMKTRYVGKILNLNQTEKGSLGSNRAEYDRLKNSRLLDPPTYNEIKNFMERAGLATDDRNDLLIDYKYFTDNLSHRRKEAFFAE